MQMFYTIFKLNLNLMRIFFQPIWFDSMGAKSACTLVKTPDITLLIDPGIAIMHPSFPAPISKKLLWMEKGKAAIKKASEEADAIVISHYHYDHFFPDDMKIYKGKTVFTKNPNEYINDSQRKRAKDFFNNIFTEFSKTTTEHLYKKPKRKQYLDPLKELPLAKNKDFKAYTERRDELLKKGRQWFINRVNKWKTYQQIPEIKLDDIEITFSEGKAFMFGKTTLRFTKPLFHGIEFSRVGWVYSTIVEYQGEKLIHTSDLNGPIIEDYAEMIIKENPTVLILDGPMTYMYGYLLNKTNLKRTIENASKIVKGIDAEIIIYDHHLPRENRFRERTEKVWETAKKHNKKLMTAAEFLGKTPVVEKTVD